MNQTPMLKYAPSFRRAFDLMEKYITAQNIDWDALVKECMTAQDNFENELFSAIYSEVERQSKK